MKYAPLTCAALTAFALSACSGLTSPILSPLQSDGHITTTGVHQLFPEDEVENVNLIALLTDGADTGTAQDNAPTTGTATYQSLIRAFAAFYSSPSPFDAKFRRNRVQDSIRIASDSRCATYLKYLSRVEKTQSQFFDGASTLLSGFGTVSTVASSGQLLAGLSTMTKGVGSEIKHSYFGTLGSDVIAPSIAVSRRDRWAKILTSQKLAIADYSVEAAVADAVEYHNSCTLNEGLEKAKALIQATSKPASGV
jgi:hypothetical protein